MEHRLQGHQLILHIYRFCVASAYGSLALENLSNFKTENSGIVFICVKLQCKFNISSYCSTFADVCLSICRLVLPFERQLRGEEYKPLPPPKPRKQYKKSPDMKSVKPDKRRKKPTEKEEKTNSKVRVYIYRFFAEAFFQDSVQYR